MVFAESLIYLLKASKLFLSEKSFVTVIKFFVKVPVLSVQILFAPPIV